VCALKKVLGWLGKATIEDRSFLCICGVSVVIPDLQERLLLCTMGFLCDLKALVCCIAYFKSCILYGLCKSFEIVES